MYCPLTGKPCTQPKNIHVTETVAGQPSHMHICNQCACHIEQLTGGVAFEPNQQPPVEQPGAFGIDPTFVPKPFTKAPLGPPDLPSQLFGLPIIPLKNVGPMGPLAYFQQLMNQMEAKHTEEELLRVPCPDCGHTLADVQAKGRLGCPACYVFFKNQVGPLLKQVHEGNGQHVGKVPHSMQPQPVAEAPSKAGENEMIRNSLEALQKKMDAAVAEERYEDAGRIRDQMKYLNSKLEA